MPEMEPLYALWAGSLVELLVPQFRHGHAQGCLLCRCLGCGRVARSVPLCLASLQIGLHRLLQSAAAADGLAVGPDLMVLIWGMLMTSAWCQLLLMAFSGYLMWSPCDAVGMLPSSDKTVVMEMTGQQSAGGSWSCGGRALRQVSEVRYLGAIFQSGQGFLPSLARLQHRAQAAWAQLSRQYGTLHCEKGMWLMLQLYGACVLPAGSFGCALWGVWLLRGQFRKAPQHFVSWPSQQLFEDEEDGANSHVA